LTLIANNFEAYLCNVHIRQLENVPLCYLLPHIVLKIFVWSSVFFTSVKLITHSTLKFFQRPIPPNIPFTQEESLHHRIQTLHMVYVMLECHWVNCPGRQALQRAAWLLQSQNHNNGAALHCVLFIRLLELC